MVQKLSKNGQTKPQVKGLFYHRASGQFFAYIGYHSKVRIDPDTGARIRTRTRTTCYFGTDPSEAVAKFYETKSEWQRVVAAERKQFEIQRDWWAEDEDFPGLGRFKPCWPEGGRDHRKVVTWDERVRGFAEMMDARRE